MPVRGRMTLGLDAYLETLVRAGQDVDNVVEEVLQEASPEVGGMLYHKLRQTSEQWTPDLALTIEAGDVLKEGNYIFIEASVGGDDQDNRQAAKAKEYGTARQAAEPFFRPTMIYFRRKGLKDWMARVLERYGLQ